MALIMTRLKHTAVTQLYLLFCSGTVSNTQNTLYINKSTYYSQAKTQVLMVYLLYSNKYPIPKYFPLCTNIAPYWAFLLLVEQLAAINITLFPTLTEHVDKSVGLPWSTRKKSYLFLKQVVPLWQRSVWPWFDALT